MSIFFHLYVILLESRRDLETPPRRFSSIRNSMRQRYDPLQNPGPPIISYIYMGYTDIAAEADAVGAGPSISIQLACGLDTDPGREHEGSQALIY